MAKSFDVGVVGAGGDHAGKSRIPSLLANRGEGLRIVAVADYNVEKARMRGQELDVPAFGTLGEMIGAVPLDGVVVVTPHSEHGPNALEALDAGLHVLGEKPMAATVVEAEEMLASAREKGLVLDIGYQYPFMVEAAVHAVRSGQIGDVRRIQANWLRQDGIPPQASFWRSAESGGVTLDLLGHVLSAALPFVDSAPIWVSAQTWRDFGLARHQDGFRAEDTVAATLRFEGGVRGLFTAAWAACIPDPEQFNLWVHGSRGTLEIP